MHVPAPRWPPPPYLDMRSPTEVLLEAVARQELPELFLFFVDSLDPLAHLGLGEHLFDRHRLQPLDELFEVIVERAQARAAVDRVSEEDVVRWMLDVVGRELRRVQAVGLVDEPGEAEELRVVRLLLEVDLVHEARRRRRDGVAPGEPLRRRLVARRQDVVVEPRAGIRPA